MSKPRTIITSRTIARCYAKLAAAHFDRALKAVDLTTNEAIEAADNRMKVVERYINRAGGQATDREFRYKL